MGAFRGAVLEGLLTGNEDHVRSLSATAFSGLEHAQHPDVVAICCADSRVPQEQMWNVDRPGTLFTPSTIGNQVWDLDGDDRIVDGGVAYAVAHAGVEAVAVVGHTGCGAVAAAYDVVTGSTHPGPRGVDLWVDQLIPVVRSALENELVDRDLPRESIINRLVEHNVDKQVQFLCETDVVPEGMPIFGFVYDFQEAYGDEPGRCYLVNVDGRTDLDTVAQTVPNEHRGVLRRLTD